MKFEAFKPDINRAHRYAVAVFASAGTKKVVIPLRSYETLEQLEEGYQKWQEFARERKISRPAPIEFVDENGKCKVLTDLLKE